VEAYISVATYVPFSIAYHSPK